MRKILSLNQLEIIAATSSSCSRTDRLWWRRVLEERTENTREQACSFSRGKPLKHAQDPATMVVACLLVDRVDWEVDCWSTIATSASSVSRCWLLFEVMWQLGLGSLMVWVWLLGWCVGFELSSGLVNSASWFVTLGGVLIGLMRSKLFSEEEVFVVWAAFPQPVEYSRIWRKKEMLRWKRGKTFSVTVKLTIWQVDRGRKC